MKQNSKWMLGITLSAVVIAGVAGDLSVKENQQSTCPWIVQHDDLLNEHGTDHATYEIYFTGETVRGVVFYGFTVADHDLAVELTSKDEIPDLRENGRSLEIFDREGIAGYRVSTDSVVPRTIYLLASTERVAPLETINARIDPARSIAIGMGPSRGASDFNGPLPRRTVPGRAILALSSTDDPASDKADDDEPLMLAAFDQDVQLCAYQISWN